MRKTIKVRAETLEQAKKIFNKKMTENVFLLKIVYESRAYKTDTGYYLGDTVEKAIESAKAKLPDPYFIKGEVVPELKANTNIKVPVLVKAEGEWSAKYRAEDYIKNRFFPDAGFGVAEHYYIVIDKQLTKKGFKGVFGIGKQENTYTVTFFIKPRIRLKYSMWSYIVAEITDDVGILNETMIKYANKGWFGKVVDLIEQGADINYCNEDGRNVLFYSCHDYEISKLIIDKGIDFRKKDNFGDNILTFCLRKEKFINDNTRKFLINKGVKEDEALVEEIRQAERQAEEDKKKWCPNCKKKVKTTLGVFRTISGHGDYTVDEADVNCEICETKIGSEISQSW